MDEGNSITKYVVSNTKGTHEKSCNATNNACSVTLEKTGTYKVVAYDSNNQEISRRYISIKIAKNGSAFTLNGETKYVISKAECANNVNTKIVNITIVPGTPGEEYSLIEYQINGISTKETDRLSFSEELESGHYDIDVAVTNYSGNTSVQRISFDIAYLIDIEYEDDHSTLTHEVVKGQNYNYLSPLLSLLILY